ncbi:serine-rich adhesin for platelets-like isoform X2 [Glossina fuscipes]|uniref:Serine-rich adhesin for platelets-like isoform X2 n=1 Tax=Glossina fuscipes TaxID=7396 RepID=A0A9C6DRC2_9MUSC|nr:serine-rich adhesin for platelets-like isoform X2 [Glossina fuscipes]
MSFPLLTLLHQEINGSYKLQSQECVNKPQPAIPLIASHHFYGNILQHQQHQQQHQQQQQQQRQQQSDQQQQLSLNQNRITAKATRTTCSVNMANTFTQMRSNDDDVISIDSMAQPLAVGEHQAPMVLSKKALHQRDADENLFLRFLELDPPNSTEATTAGQATPAASDRRSSGSKPVGRTPFTMTKKLTRTAERGFGFSIVWTHPPRVEKIEAGLSADRSGILPGDYVIFVDKHNVVTMPEADVLNLIRSQGATLTLEIFRRSGSGTAIGSAMGGGAASAAGTSRSYATNTLPMNGKMSRIPSGNSNYAASEELCINANNVTKRTIVGPAAAQPASVARPPTACSMGTSSSIEAAKRRLNLPQVTFSKESIAPISDNRRKFLLQLISREQNFMSALHFGMQRFVQPLQERKDLITPNDHRTLFQNIDELLRISEDILEQLCHDDQEPQMNFASRVYLSKTTAICAAYKKYCNGIKRADCVLVNKSRQTGSEFISFITEPPVPRKRPDLTMFIHRPLQHFREILKLMQLLASNCHVDTEEHKNFTTVISELQAAYREITVSSGLMEPLGEGRPLLTLQDLESRMVFTKCKPFTLAVQGRQWIFGGDLSRVEGRSVKPYWTLLFSDIIVFAKVSRDRVLFITEEPIPIANIVDSCFHMRKKTTEFRLTVDPNGRLAESPTGYCAPDLTKTPKKGARRKSLILRAPSLELKAVWQNLLQRQIFLVNAALGSTPLSSPLDSPDVLNTLVPLSDIGVASASIGSIKLSSMDSINIRNQHQQQQQQHQQSNRLSNVSEQIEKLIDEKCRFLNKTGTAKSSALHLANWMKGQLDKQQEQARLAAARSPETLAPEDEHILYTDSDQDERITYWTRQQLEKRTKELNLVKENGYIHAKTNGLGKRLSGVEEISMSDNFSEGVSQSHSTTSDSQITVRSSPIVLDKLAVCRHCHKNCQQNQNSSPSAVGKTGVGQTQPSSPPPPCTKSIKTNLEDSSNTTGLISNSLKVQHSQSSPNRCCKINGSGSRASSVTSISSSTVTGEHPSERSSSKLIASSSKRETGDTESDVAQLISDDVYQSEATDEGGLASSISGSSGVEEVRKLITHNIHKLRILDEHNEANVLLNGHYLGSGGGDECTRNEKQQMEEEAAKLASPKRFRITPQVAKEVDENNELADQEVLTTVTVTEIATVVKNEPPSQTPKSPSKPQTPKPTKSPSKLSHSSGSPCKQFVPCNCPCRPADFANTTLSPDELEHETCKLLESPRKSPVLTSNKQEDKLEELYENIHKNCKCICGGEESDKTDPQEEDNVENHAIKADSDEEEDLSLMLIGLAQLTPAAKLLNMKTPTAPMPTPTTTSSCYIENGFVPTIAVVPPTPDSVLTKTSTNVWDNSGTHMSVTTSTATNLLISNVPRQAIIENIPEDSCDESPLDEEPPYRPMNTTLRRYGTMSSLERLPSEDRLEPADNMPEYQDDDEEDDDDDEELMDKARADNIELDNEIRVVTKALYNHRNDDDDDEDDDDDIDEEADELLSGAKSNGAAWASRASTFVAGKMSFFEESRAFIDKYLGRWNQDHSSSSIQNNNSETDEQMDECTSGATSGEEVWGTPTSGGDNDELHLANSENTHSSPTKSSNSLNDDDDTELMMDELLMAPPMTASTIRGLLPRFYRRRLEPLFEEETESDEEKTQQESEELKKGETTTNGHYLEDSEAGSSSDEDPVNEADYDEEDEEDLTSTEDRLQPNLQTTILGPRPLRNPTANHSLPSTVLKASSCEYLLEPRAAKPLITSATINNNDLVTACNSETVTPIISSMTLTTTMTTSSTTDKDVSMKVTAATTQSLVHSQTSTTTSNVNVTIKQEKDECYSRIEEVAKNKTMSRPAKFIPPPPPPRRLLLTRTNLKTGGPYTATTKAPLPPVRSGASADNGYSAGADESVDPTVGIMNVTPASKMTPRKSQRPDVCNIKTSEENTEVTKVRPSSTIIETSLLGMVEKKPVSTSSTTVSMTNEKEKVPQPKPRQTKQQTQTTDISSRGDERTTKSPCALAGVGSGLSPRLEMRLALNHDILGDEDLICYDPGPDLTTILGHDLSTFHRLTGRDLLNRSATNRVQPKEAVISYSQQRNSKMDTPTVNRRTRTSLQLQQQTLTTAASATPFVGSARVGGVPQHLQPNRNTWSSSASAVPSRDGNVNVAANCKDYSYSSDENKLSDLEILARREKIYCMSQLKSGSLARTGTATTTMTTSMTATMKSNNLSSSSQALAMMTMTTTTTEDVNEGTSQRTRKLVRDETALMDFSKANKLFNFIKRRNSELSSSANCSQISLNDSNANSTPVHRGSPVSPRKDNDKPSLNRRLWKHLTKRRRANSVSEIAAS